MKNDERTTLRAVFAWASSVMLVFQLLGVDASRAFAQTVTETAENAATLGMSSQGDAEKTEAQAPAHPAFDREADLGGTRVRVSAAEGAFPEDANLDVAIPQGEEAEHAMGLVASARPEGMDPQTSELMTVKVLSAGGDELQTTEGEKATVAIEREGLLADGREAYVYEVSGEAATPLEQHVEGETVTVEVTLPATLALEVVLAGSTEPAEPSGPEAVEGTVEPEPGTEPGSTPASKGATDDAKKSEVEPGNKAAAENPVEGTTKPTAGVGAGSSADAAQPGDAQQQATPTSAKDKVGKNAAQQLGTQSTPTMTPQADAVNPFYIDEDGEPKFAEGCTDFSNIVDQEGAQLQDGWYVATQSHTFQNRIEVTGNANLILGDGVTLTFERGIHIIQRYSPRLHIWCQWERSGKLVATGGKNQAGIGGNDGESNGALVIHGGTVEATGGDEAAGIGGGNEADCGIVEIRGGKVTATATGKYGAGIGGGDQGAGGTITISQSTAANGIETEVTATGADYGAGIGSGDEAGGDSGTVTITGGTVEATGGVEAAGIGSGNECAGGVGTVTISGGTVTATGNVLGAGIGGGDEVSNGVTKILGGNVTANGGDGAAGIGGGENGHGGTVEVSGGTVSAFGGTTIADSIYSGAGIGGGDCGNGGTVNISGGSVTAVGANRCAGIGGGNTGNGGTVNISGGSVDARGGNEAAGIGGSINGDGGTVTIGGDANVTVHGGKHAAGIGGGSGSDAKGADVTIEHAATVTAFVNSDGMSGVQAIGHGKHGTDEGSIIVRSGERVFYNKNAPSDSGALAANVDQQYDACHAYYVRIEPCTHPSGFGNKPTYHNETTHWYGCIYCAYDSNGEEPHVFDEDGNCPCGAQKINFVYSENSGENRSTTVTEIHNAAGQVDTTYVIKPSAWEHPHYDFNDWLCEGNGKSRVLAPGASMRYSDLKQYLVPGGGAHALNLKAQWQQRKSSIRISSVLKSSVPTDQNLKFVYKIQLSDTSFNETISGIKFENGVSQIFLVGRQPITILGLPEGVGYTVIQVGPADETLADNAFLTKGSNDIGTTSSGVSDVTFTNTRKQGSLALSVEVKSPTSTDKDKGFPVEVRATGNEANSFTGTYGDLVFEGGAASLTLADGQTALATDLPSGTYTVKWGADDDFIREPSEDSQTISVEGVGYNQQPVAPVEASATYTRKLGKLKVMKEVQGGTLSDSERPFALTVTLSDPSINGTFGDMTFVDGVAKFSLKHEESRIATGLPRGVSYTVEETPVAGFEAYKYGVAGTIGEWISEARFTSAHQQGNLEVALAVKSSTAADKTKAFSVVVRLSDATVSGWYGDMLFRDGVATFTLCDGESKVAEGLPAGVDYEVSQAELPGFTLTTSGATGAIEAVKARATLTNVRAEGGLLVLASVTSPIASERGRSFPVTVELKDSYSLNGTYGDMTFNNGQATFTIGDGGAKLATGLLAGTEYTVTTDAGDEFEGKVEGSEGSLSATESSRVQIAYARLTGSVEVSNEVSQGSNSDNQRPFSYTMELSDRSISGTYGDLEFVNGLATFTLSHQQKKELTGLPTGIVCTVRQEQLAGFTADSLEKEAVVPAEAQALAFTNTRQTGSLTVSNAVTGGSATTFKYTVRLSDTSVCGTYGGMEFDYAGAATFTLGNGESKKATGLPAGVTYTVEQTSVDGSPVDGYLTTSSGAAGSIGTAESTASFSNTYANAGLVVSNQVVSDVPADHRASKTFAFTVKVSGADVADKTVGDVQFDENSQTTFSLADGQAKALTGLPAGASYVVSQVADDGFRSGAVDWPSGTVPAEGAATVAWRNVRKTGGLRISNAVESYLPADASREFIYTVTLRDTVTLQDVPISGTYGGLRFVDGRATKTLRGHQTVTAEGLPAGVTYRVEQKADAGFDTTPSGVDGLVATGVVAATGKPVAPVAFSNVRKNAMLTVTNSVRNNEDKPIDGVEFGYVVTLSDRGVSAKFGDLLFQNGVARFGLVDGQFKMITGLPQGMGYTVSQQPAIGFATSATDESGIIGSDGATASFTNTQLQQTAVLQVKKKVAGERYNGNESFTFRLAKQDAAIGDILPDVRTATAGNGETASFAPITFVQPGTYYYTISEVSPVTPFAKMGYNTSTYWARVVVTRTSTEQSGPALQAKVTYGPSKREATQEELTITNEYNHPPLTVSFQKNNGSAVDKQSVSYGSTVAKPSDPTRAGHTFKGWYADQALGKAYSFRSKVTQNLTLYAKWNVNFYTVEFESNGGSNVEAQGFTYGSKVTKPADPTRVGHTFAGWFTDAKLTKAYDFSSMVTSKLTLYAKWQANMHTVTFASNGGSAVAAQRVAYGSAVAKPANPTRAGYTFKGWYTDKALTRAYNFSAKVTSDRTLYAKWQVNTYTVTFASNGGTAVATQRVTHGSKAQTPKAPSRTGHAFKGWFADAKLTKAYNFSTKVTGNLTLYAKWQANMHTVTFVPNGGSAVAAQRAAYGSKVTKPANPTRVGHTFAGWFSDAKLTKAYDFSAKVTGDLTLYAKWQVNVYTVTFEPNGGSAVAAQRVAYGSAAARPSDPTRAGHAFEGWYADQALTRAYDFSAQVTSDLTLYAKWQAHDPSVDCRAHVQRLGWLDTVRDGVVAGTTGQSRRLEAIQLSISNLPYRGSIEYLAHVQTTGWQSDWERDGQTSGTTGKSKRLEAVQIRLTDELSNYYDVWYRVHVQRIGWMGWAKNGQTAGTTGESRRAEAIQVVLVPKGQTEPPATYMGESCAFAQPSREA